MHSRFVNRQSLLATFFVVQSLRLHLLLCNREKDTSRVRRDKWRVEVDNSYFVAAMLFHHKRKVAWFRCKGRAVL